MKIVNCKASSPSAFIQYKGTDICMDFYCECGHNFHIDGYFAYYVQCTKCGLNYEMPSEIKPIKIDCLPKGVEPLKPNRNETNT